MSDMPERIWATPYSGKTDSGPWQVDRFRIGDGGTEYRLASAPVTLVEALTCPEVQAMVEALRALDRAKRAYDNAELVFDLDARKEIVPPDMEHALFSAVEKCQAALAPVEALK